MRFRSRARADLAIRVFLLLGLAVAVAGVVTVMDRPAAGLALVCAGLVLANAQVAISAPEGDAEPRSGPGE